jgi:hypothetical protein
MGKPHAAQTDDENPMTGHVHSLDRI